MELNGYPFKTRLYWLGCDDHPTVYLQNEINEKQNHELFTEFVIGMKSKDILKELLYGDFKRYSCVCLIINFFCTCDPSSSFIFLLKSLKRNDTLRLVTKMVMFYTFIRAPCDGGLVNLNLNYLKFNMDVFELNGIRVQVLDVERDDSKVYLRESSEVFVVVEYLQNQNKILRDKWNYALQSFLPIDNLILIQLGVFDKPNCSFIINGVTVGLGSNVNDFVKSFTLNRENPVQQLVADISQKANKSSKNVDFHHNPILYSSTNCNYIFAINPALAIIINHMTFSDPNLPERQNSKKDVQILKSTLTKIKIPQLIVHDGSSQDVKNIMSLVECSNLSILKYLIIIVMSHGKEGDVIETRTDPYHVYEDIIDRLQANSSLNHTELVVLVNACRGDYDPQFAMEDEMAPQIEETDTSIFQKNLVLWFSTQKKYVSYLHKNGACFLQEFCKVVDKLVCPQPMREIALKVDIQIKNQLKRIQQIPEYLSHPDSVHIFEIFIENLIKYQTVLEKLQKFVEKYPLHDQRFAFTKNRKSKAPVFARAILQSF